MSKYVSRSVVICDGSRIQNLKNFKKGAVKHGDTVKLMDGSGVIEVTKTHTFSVDYALPKENPVLDWTIYNGKNWSVELAGGKRIEYVDVELLDEGEFTTDGEKEAVMTLMFQADSRSLR